LPDNQIAIVILLASTVSCALVLVEIAVVAPEFLRAAITPLVIMVITLGVLSLPFWFLQTKGRNAMPSQGNPTELKGALSILRCSIPSFYWQSRPSKIFMVLVGSTLWRQLPA